MAVSDLGSSDYFTTLVVTSIDVTEVADDGGATVAITGEFLNAEHTVSVFFEPGSGETPCYMAASGEGTSGFPLSPTCLTFATPPLAKGGPYSIVVRTGAQEAYLVGAFTVRNRNWHRSVYSLRKSLPPVLRTGPRNLDVTDLLAGADITSDDLFFGVAAKIDEGFEFSDGWPNTVADTDPNPSFTTATLDDGFENADGWPGT